MTSTEAPEGVDPATGEIIGPVRYPDHIRLNHEPMDETEAKQITRRIKTYGVRMCQEIVRAHDGAAHLALGCKTWDDYCADHLGISRQRAHQVLDAARKTSNLALMVECSPDLLAMPERWLRGVPLDELEATASTAVDAVDPEASDDERAAAVVEAVEHLHRTKVTARRSESITTEFSSDKHPPSGDAPGEQVPAPAAPGATSTGEPRHDAATRPGDSETEQEDADKSPASDLTDDAAPDAVAAASGESSDHAGEAPDVEATQAAESSPPSPTSDPEPISSAGSGSPDRARVSGLFAAALELASFSSDDVAALYVGEDREHLFADALRLQVWAADLSDVLEHKGLRSVTA